jgi:hypothetical protein
MYVDCDEAQQALIEAGLAVEGPSQSVLDIAEDNDVTPQVVADVVLSVARPATPEEIASGLAGGRGRGLRQPPGPGVASGSEGGGTQAAGALMESPEPSEHQESEARFPRPGSGLGRMTLRGYARDYGFDLDELLGILERQGLEVDPDARFSSAAVGLGIVPGDIITALNTGG